MANSNHEKLDVRRGRLYSVDVYDVKAEELDILEKGSSASVYQTFGVVLLSAAVACLVALFTAEFKSPVIQNGFIIVTVIGFILGALLICLWLKERKSVTEIVSKIKARLEEQKPKAEE